MRPLAIIGLILILLGILAFSYQGVIWVTGREQVAQIGPVEVERQKDYPVPLAPILGGVAVIGGVLLLMAGAKRTG
jgi:hypothetical protein